MATPPKKPTGAGTPTPARRKPAARKPRAEKSTVTANESSATPAPSAATPTPEPTQTATKKPSAPKTAPRPRTRKAPARPNAPKAPTKSSATSAKPALSKSYSKASTANGPGKLVSDARKKIGDPTFFGAIFGGIAAIGAAVTGLFFLRRSTTTWASNPGATAHQADGTDSSKSFEAGIADEGTIPDKI